MTPHAATPLRITAVATHPIQYQAPWFRALAARDDVALEVLFEHLPDAKAQGEGFGQPFQWDVPLLDGYPWRVLGAGKAGGRAWLPRAAVALRAALQRHAPEVVLLTGWQSALLALAPDLAHRQGSAVLVRGDANRLRPRPSWKAALHRALVCRYDGFLAVGCLNHDFYVAAGADPARIFACPHFVDNDGFRHALETLDRGEQRRRFGVPEDAVCVLFAGKLEAKKRPLDAIAALREAGPGKLHLLVVGSGALEGALREAAAGLPVSFTGFLNQSAMPAAYAAADCLALPSDHGETWGLVVNEAMACGRPAIVSDQVGCAPDLVTPGETGWVYPAGNVQALAATLREVAVGRDRLPALGACARRRVCEAFSVARATEAVVHAGRDVVGDASRPGGVG